MPPVTKETLVSLVESEQLGKPLEISDCPSILGVGSRVGNLEQTSHLSSVLRKCADADVCPTVASFWYVL